ncbi:hypothetical protein HBH98_150410 [Parastagonospora nodorum]|nr:hypothetical protein HBH51_137530 [Parastagonospora nodorum]KAH4006973.1 hypothetical protein HBI10_013720 [Parastagonospora nodorum]KAH4025611.1 hypothetical protein HBI13_067640 [Parastagonospora nodorum]KAH4059167.1 hypothetical protein HBH49_014760 [Parastagonospora nodorum]KAH4098804.1 hypothetical protein HBH46_154900 [Parastagonospora nodorum]
MPSPRHCISNSGPVKLCDLARIPLTFCSTAPYSIPKSLNDGGNSHSTYRTPQSWNRQQEVPFRAVDAF